MLDLIEQHSVSLASNDKEGIEEELTDISDAFSRVLATHILKVACYDSRITKKDLGEENRLSLLNILQKFALSSIDELVNMICNRYLTYL